MPSIFTAPDAIRMPGRLFSPPQDSQGVDPFLDKDDVRVLQIAIWLYFFLYVFAISIPLALREAWFFLIVGIIETRVVVLDLIDIFHFMYRHAVYKNGLLTRTVDG